MNFHRCRSGRLFLGLCFAAILWSGCSFQVHPVVRMAKHRKSSVVLRMGRPNTASSSILSGSGVKGILGSSVASAIHFLNSEVKSMSRGQKWILVTAVLVGFLLGKMKPFWQRFSDVNEIPTSRFGASAAPLVGRVVRVTDGDTLRLYHTPLPWLSAIRSSLSRASRNDDGDEKKKKKTTTTKTKKTKKKKEKLSTTTLPIRVCTIDTPETAKFGKPGQPFGEEAKEELSSFVGGKIVRVKLLQKDQYGRAVAHVSKGWGPFQESVDERMLRKGLAEVYTGMGAVYGPLGKEAYVDMEAKAKTEGAGIWSDKNRESAADFKKRTKG